VVVVFDSEYMRVEHHTREHLVVMRRSAKPIPDAWGDEFAKLRFSLLAVDRASTSLLVDIRLATIRGDETMDRVTEAFQEITRGFRKSAVLVRTATGLLQIGRAAREGSMPTQGFMDEGKALTYLRGR
jgi:hypothetical protein